ncbi:membrane-spanning 4-domains subfamily A member 15-like protein [Lates japonicus]|uniref:Membrane-spanning 4-domains subfamily A member 15-like protein n=1 Tax=Lates japonicus TaxID=270547 RepID=A0AAD3NA79_LATJO|nr:membrane-spanning 4-domains subfamily A member 15-like protein [Lates japonicus]
MSASAPVTTVAVGGVVVVTHVIPAPQAAAPQNSPQENKISWVQLVGLGTVQIVVGLMVFVLGIIKIRCGYTLEFQSGAFVWEAACFITVDL